MASNQKLIKLIKGRTISGTSQADNVMTITFSDGSKLTVKTAASNTNSAATGGVIDKVRQKGTEFDLDLQGGGTITITTAEATSSVMLRDKNGKMEYAD
jgi:frataxin-like iron-binding protein CyaY